MTINNQQSAINDLIKGLSSVSADVKSMSVYMKEHYTASGARYDKLWTKLDNVEKELHNKIKAKTDDIDSKVSKKVEDMDKRISRIEKIGWVTMGAIMLASLIYGSSGILSIISTGAKVVAL